MESRYLAEFYRTRGSGKMPAKEFIDGLTEDEQATILAMIKRLKASGRLPMPYAEHLEGKIWQLRMKKRRRLVRITYAILSGRRILLLTGFMKKTSETPRPEIELAQRYLEDHTED